MRTYSELITLDSLEARFEYLALDSDVGYATFGYNRWINQNFYRSREWKEARSFVIARDLGCELGVGDFPIAGPPQVHHLNPITLEDIEFASDGLLNPENLISVSHRLHNSIHFGDASQLPTVLVPRKAGDTRLW